METPNAVCPHEAAGAQCTSERISVGEVARQSNRRRVGPIRVAGKQQDRQDKKKTINSDVLLTCRCVS